MQNLEYSSDEEEQDQKTAASSILSSERAGTNVPSYQPLHSHQIYANPMQPPNKQQQPQPQLPQPLHIYSEPEQDNQPTTTTTTTCPIMEVHDVSNVPALVVLHMQDGQKICCFPMELTNDRFAVSSRQFAGLLIVFSS